MIKEEHLNLYKERALKYVDTNDLQQTYTSMVSDLSKHPDTVNHIDIQLGLALLMGDNLDTADKMIKFINDFN